jgi:carbohydrate-selective porin OprB
MLSFRAEYRDTLGTDIPPTRLGSEFGSLGIVGTGFSDFQGNLSELAWRQTVFGGRMKFGFGKISATSWYNGHVLSTPKRGFQNLALQSSNAKPAPGRGIGFVTGFRLGKQFAVIGGIHDANARTTENPFDTIGDKEFFQSVEFRWFPTTFERHAWDQVRLQIWHQDERTEAGVPSSQGVTFLASRLFKDKLMPFFFGGMSDGDASQMEIDLTGGVAIALNTAHRAARDVLGVGLSWGRPSNSAFRDQYTAELFYRFQLVQHIAITPSVQYIVDPAASEENDQVWAGGLRLRLTF